jgi:hypothetical protein
MEMKNEKGGTHEIVECEGGKRVKNLTKFGWMSRLGEFAKCSQRKARSARLSEERSEVRKKKIEAGSCDDGEMETRSNT